MPRYRGAKIEGGTFFFTLTLADRSTRFGQHIDNVELKWNGAASHFGILASGDVTCLIGYDFRAK
jgi:hypothetical protein